MKKLLVLLVFCFGFFGFSQAIKPKHEVKGQLIKSTYFHDNGMISQVGYFKNKKPHGSWISYDEAGNKVSVGQYEEGIKVGKWFFWSGAQLKEVDFLNNKIINIKNWTSQEVVHAETKR